MAKQQAKKQGKKQRKFGRNAIWCLAYKNRNQRVRNKKVKLTRHIEHHKNDSVAQNCLDNI